MSSPSHAVDDEMVKPSKLFELFICDVVHVRTIGDIAESVAQNRQREMLATYGCDFYIIDSEWFFVYDVNLPVRRSRVFDFGECV